MPESKAREPLKPGPDGIVRLSGGNPQISKGYGDVIVQTYIAAMPGWQSTVGRKLDAIIERTVPGVEKAVKWNTPFYGMEKDVWFMGYHCMTRYVKVSFFQGAHIDPMPPGTSKQANVRYLDIYEDDVIDETLFADWVKQASILPGEKM
ncbi:MAG: histidine kinase [Pelagibacterium sp. SCN 63-23]|nr:MAG: histidine kinase [Pelagibacterium sp. SCN 63-23]